MKRKALSAGVLVFAARAVFAQQGPVPEDVPALKHVSVIMMENHGFVQVLNNSANLATNYFAVAHPSPSNYLRWRSF
jgi:phosphatidylinositol-3-phosphatase